MKTTSNEFEKKKTFKYATILILVIFACIICYSSRIFADSSNGMGDTYYIGNRDFKWPVPSFQNISSCFLDPDAVTITHERPKYHFALDIYTGYAVDVVAAYDGTVVMATDNDFTGPINLGNPDEFSILEFANKVILKTNSKSEIINCPLPHDDPTQRKPDISLAKEKLNWEPKIMLDKGLDKTIEYYKNIIN